ncbi:Rpd3L histone deacetylase complex subunit [Saccharomycopsis crataegensis]|uniref:Rpd3L histone deacetylase complex subunit n=1 Tax=Saccharomycopsis crataegensis TaxID=43959 RepID=A0AAV5QDL5_9ASCO|nr:Rpd3L histone deacetylase complex subunit [Saccharomycopsis crataegensis]
MSTSVSESIESSINNQPVPRDQIPSASSTTATLSFFGVTEKEGSNTPPTSRGSTTSATIVAKPEPSVPSQFEEKQHQQEDQQEKQQVDQDISSLSNNLLDHPVSVATRFTFSSESSELSELSDSDAETEKMNYTDKEKSGFPMNANGEFESHLLAMSRDNQEDSGISDPNEDEEMELPEVSSKDILKDNKESSSEETTPNQDEEKESNITVYSSENPDVKSQDQDVQVEDQGTVKEEQENEEEKEHVEMEDEEKLKKEDSEEAPGPSQAKRELEDEKIDDNSDMLAKKRKIESNNEQEDEIGEVENHSEEAAGHGDDEDEGVDEREEVEEDEEVEDDDEEEEEEEEVDEAGRAERAAKDEELLQQKKQEEAMRLKFRKEAIDKLTEIEIEFARLKDKLYDDKLKAFESEIQMCINGTHPALKSIYERIENHRTKKLQLVQNRQKYQLLCIDRQTRSQRLAIHQQFLKEKAESKMSIIDKATINWYDINRNRKTMNMITPEYSFRVPSKADQIQHVMDIEEEIDVLSYVNKNYGFSVGEKLSGSTKEEVSEDLMALGIA